MKTNEGSLILYSDSTHKLSEEEKRTEDMSWSPPSNDSSVSSGSEDSSSEVQSQLQSVLVRVKIQEPSKQTYEKRVRFNSLVEVRFIPKVKSKKNSDKNKNEKEKTEPQTESAIENEMDVANGNDTNILEEKNKERSDPEKNTTNEDCKTENKNKNAKSVGKSTSSATKSFDGGEIHVSVIAREGLCLPKVTIGQEYEGAQMRTSKTVPKLQPRNSIHRHQSRRGNNESRINSLSAKAVIHLERQAMEFYEQANAMLFGQEEKKDLENQEGGSPPQSSTRSKSSSDNLREYQDRESNRLYRSKSLPEFRRSSLQLVDLKEAKEIGEVRPMTEQTSSRNENMKKLSTSLPYINIGPNVTGKARQDSKDSYTKLYLPQLHRRSEEIKRMNETVLRKKPKYCSDKQPSSPNESNSPLGFGVEKKNDKNESPPPASSHSIVRYSHGLDIARLLNTAHYFY